jgi:HAD superfamily hydrolase (TIGR01459 family)
MLQWAQPAWPGAVLVMMLEIKGLRDVAQSFDAMLIDQFGVIHDGQTLYAGAAEVMRELYRLHIPVVVMTNSGKRAQPNAERIVKMGIPRAHFVNCVSSGEVGYQSLSVKRALLIGKQDEDYGFDPIQFVENPEDAEVMLILGSNAPATSMEDYRGIFESITLPAVCCNPDKLMLTSKGLQPAPGAIASLYEERGGAVTWIGKPYRGIYDFALSQLGKPARVLCIGDSAEHDVAGGRAAGLSTLLVQQGVSGDVAAKDLNPRPDYLLSAFRW